MKFFETSAKSGECVNDAFMTISREAYKKVCDDAPKS